MKKIGTLNPYALDLFDATTYKPKEAQMYLEIIFDWYFYTNIIN